MNKRVNPGCLIGIIVYAVPVIAMLVFGVSADAVSAAIFSLILSSVIMTFVFSTFGDKLSSNAQAVVYYLLIVTSAVIMFVTSVNIFKIDVFDEGKQRLTSNDSSTSITSSSGSKSISSAPRGTDNPKASTLKDYYQENFPMTWGYIKKYADDPESYLNFYHSVWGKLQKYTGDGIPFDTLTPYEMSLVNYQSVGANIYLIGPDATTYHSTPNCYTLLRSDIYYAPSGYSIAYEPCSKCVGE